MREIQFVKRTENRNEMNDGGMSGQQKNGPEAFEGNGNPNGMTGGYNTCLLYTSRCV